MKPPAVAFLLWFVAVAPGRASELPRTLLIERSAAPARLGQKATLTVSPLKRRDDRFTGSYTVVVSPLPVANEAGSFEVVIPPEALQNLTGRRPIVFAGSATNDAGKSRTVKGTATPKDGRSGEIQLEIVSERGKLHYKTTYRLP